MTHLPYLLLTPLVWIVLSEVAARCLLFVGKKLDADDAVLFGFVFTLALWGVLLLVIN